MNKYKPEQRNNVTIVFSFIFFFIALGSVIQLFEDFEWFMFIFWMCIAGVWFWLYCCEKRKCPNHSLTPLEGNKYFCVNCENVSNIIMNKKGDKVEAYYIFNKNWGDYSEGNILAESEIGDGEICKDLLRDNIIELYGHKDRTDNTND